jgi:hypothetical protein
VRLVELSVGSDVAAWERLGFAIVDGGVPLGSTVIRPTGAGGGILGWTVSGLSSDELDGLPTTVVDAADGAPAAHHPNGAVSIDHVVVSTPDLDRTVAALERGGLELRRERDAGGGVRQAFLWVGDVILEVVSRPDGDPAAPASFWGMVAVVADLEAAAAVVGDGLGDPRDAVQPGRRIATVRSEAGIGLPLALMTPHVKRKAA